MSPTRRLRVACTAACASGAITPTTGTRSSSWSCGSAAEVAALQATRTSFTPWVLRKPPISSAKRRISASGRAGGPPRAATLYEPTDAPPAGGFPAVAMFHGLGGTRASVDPLARQFFADQGYVVLAFDARGHGASGGLWGLDGPNENADARAVFDFLAARPEVAAGKIGAFGVSLGGGAVWNSAVIGKVPWAAIAPEATWIDLYSALFPQNLPKSGVLAQLASLVPASRTDPEILSREQDAISGVDLPSLRPLTSARSVAGRLGGFTTPTLVLQGRRDFLFDVDQARRAFAELGGPKRLYLGDFGHAPSDFASAPDLVPMSPEA